MWTKQRTRQGDTLSTLARDYGTTVEQIVAANGVCPPAQHSDRYLSQQAQAYMLPTNLPRRTLSKLVLERDIQKWVRAIGGDCEDIREGSQTQTARLLSCPPGHYCRFTSDTAINLPLRKRLAGVSLGGLGAVSVMDTVAYLNSVKQWAKDFGDYVVNNANTNEDNVDSWRDAFIGGMNGKINVATRADSSGVPAFVRDPSLIQKVADFATAKAIEAKQFNRSLADRLSAMAADVQAGVAAALRSVADTLAPGAPPAVPASTKTAGSTAQPAASDILAPVRAGTATVKRGQKGAAVSAVQSLLLQKLPKAKIPSGFSADGDFGPRTETAVKNFQTVASLAVNGVVDKSTLLALEGSVSVNVALDPSTGRGGGSFTPTSTTLADVRAGKTLARSQSGAGVREAQALLNAKGIRGSDGKALTVDSLFGAQAESAVKAAQARASLPTSGVLDRDTLLAIESDFARVGAPLVQAQSLGKSNTMLYVGVAAVALLAAAAVAKKRKRAA